MRRRPSGRRRTASWSPRTAPRRWRRCCGCASSRRCTTRRQPGAGRRDLNVAFERFYTDHLKKILLVRGGQRYLSKGNYNLTRFAYLLKLFPDARFVVPVRDPRWHIASLMKQHRLFDAEERRDPRSSSTCAGRPSRVRRRPAGDQCRRPRYRPSIATLWREGQEVRGWARYWAMLYGFVIAQQERDPAVRQASLIIRYEDLCDQAEATLASVFAHVGLELPPADAVAMAARLSQPGYYQLGFTAEEEAIIADETGPSPPPWATPDSVSADQTIGAPSLLPWRISAFLQCTIMHGQSIASRQRCWPTQRLRDSVPSYGCGGWAQGCGRLKL